MADANLVIYLVLKGEHSKEAEAIRSRDRHWLAPQILRSELLSGLQKYINDGQMSRDVAIRAYHRGVSLVTFPDQEPDPRAIFNLCSDSACSTYDAQYVALAMDRDVELVTADKKLQAMFPDHAVGFAAFLLNRR